MENLTTETFKEKVFDYAQEKEWSYKGDKPAIIDFYADWCGPCKTVALVLEEIDNEYEGLNVYKINTEEQNKLAATFGIQSIPALLFVPIEGQPQMALGAIPKETLKKAVKEVLGLDDPMETKEDEKTEDKEETTK